MRSMRVIPFTIVLIAGIVAMVAFGRSSGDGDLPAPDRPIATWRVVTATPESAAIPVSTSIPRRYLGELPRDVDESGRAVAAVEAVAPAVVTVINLTTSQRSATADEAYLGVASGVVVDDRGHVVSSLRGVGEFGDVVVVLADGTVLEAQRVLVDRDAAIVILHVDPSPLVDVRLATTDPVLGEVVLAIGAPLQVLPFSVTRGIVSRIDVDVPPTSQFPAGSGLIQHDAAVNIAGDGGPLIDLDGRIVGVTVIALTADDAGVPIYGMAFAVPASRIAAALAALP